eukprot:CAMPEP_0114381582 /NCGR_PEP_ID=MMETSP0102-20121206/3534_1 /TAXON_ID=38822 ORGANISM="Pteridomonas danica, Strain PT" /NCGR_SAMPLE_ID=MMETSP0102 /ASSEMBLY_ACC=CAM_ASM_000212 /LENGTH=2385 /DNA_ID=CAMNT_0001537089 /DNA_START=224 /DNA_END=7378 /DNA_ORIENTATION=+
MAHELAVAFPDMPPIRDFCAVGMMAPTALEEVTEMYGGHPSAAAAILRRSSMGPDDQDRKIISLPKRAINNIWDMLFGESTVRQGPRHFDSLGDVEMGGEDDYDDDDEDDGQSIVSRASSAFPKRSPAFPPNNGSPIPSNTSHGGAHQMLSSSLSSVDVDVDYDQDLLDSEMQHLSDNESNGSSEPDLHKQFPFCPLPKHEAGTMVDKAFSETGSFSDFGGVPLSRTSSRYFSGQQSSVDLDGITVVESSDESLDDLDEDTSSSESSGSESDDDSDSQSIASFSSASVNLDGSFQTNLSESSFRSSPHMLGQTAGHRAISQTEPIKSLSQEFLDNDDDDGGSDGDIKANNANEVSMKEPFRPQFGGKRNKHNGRAINKVVNDDSSSCSSTNSSSYDQVVNVLDADDGATVNTNATNGSGDKKVNSVHHSRDEVQNADKEMANELIGRVSRGEITPLEASKLLKEAKKTNRNEATRGSSPSGSTHNFLNDKDDKEAMGGSIQTTRIHSTNPDHEDVKVARKKNLFNLSKDDISGGSNQKGGGGGGDGFRSGSVDNLIARNKNKNNNFKLSSKNQLMKNPPKGSTPEMLQEASRLLSSESSDSLIDKNMNDKQKEQVSSGGTVGSRRNISLLVRTESSSSSSSNNSSVQTLSSAGSAASMVEDMDEKVNVGESGDLFALLNGDEDTSANSITTIDEDQPVSQTSQLDVSPTFKRPSYSAIANNGPRPSPRSTSSSSFTQSVASLPSPRPRRNSLNSTDQLSGVNTAGPIRKSSSLDIETNNTGQPLPSSTLSTHAASTNSMTIPNSNPLSASNDEPHSPSILQDRTFSPNDPPPVSAHALKEVPLPVPPSSSSSLSPNTNVLNEARVIGTGSIQLIITVLGGTHPILVQCEPNDTVIATKRKLAKEMGSPVDALKLIYAGAGRSLQNGRTLAFYGITNKTGLSLSVDASKTGGSVNPTGEEGGEGVAGKGLRRRASGSERTGGGRGAGGRGGRGQSPRGIGGSFDGGRGKGGRGGPESSSSGQSFDSSTGKGKGVRRNSLRYGASTTGNTTGGAPGVAVSDHSDSNEHSSSGSEDMEDDSLSSSVGFRGGGQGGGGPNVGEDDDSYDSDNTIDTTTTSIRESRKEREKNRKQKVDPFHVAKLQRVHNIVDGLKPEQVQSLLKGLMEGVDGDAVDWRRDKPPLKNNNSKNESKRDVFSNKKSPSHPTTAATAVTTNNNAAQSYQSRYKKRIQENNEEGLEWWDWVDHSSSSFETVKGVSRLDSRLESLGSLSSGGGPTSRGPNGGGNYGPHGTGLGGDNNYSINESFKFDTTSGVDVAPSSTMKSNRKLSQAERRAARRAKRRGAAELWAEQHTRRVRRLESYHQRALQKRLVRVLKEGTVRAHYEAGDREELQVTMLLLCFVLLVSVIDYFSHDFPDGDILFCQIPYLLSVMQYKPVALPLWFLLAVIGQFTELEGKFGDNFKGFFGVGRDPYIEGTIWGSWVTRSPPTIGVLAIVCGLLCPWYALLLPLYSIPIVVFLPAILFVILIIIGVTMIPPTIYIPASNDDHVIEKHRKAEKALSNSALNKSRILDRRASVANVSTGKVSLPPLTLPHPAAPSSGATAFSAFCAIWRRAQYYAPLSRRRRAMIQREINERNQLLGKEAYNIILNNVYNEKARISQDFEDEENALRYEPNITESLITHMVGIIQMLGFVALCIPLIELYHFNGNMKILFENLMKTALSPVSLFYQIVSFFTWPYASEHHYHKNNDHKNNDHKNNDHNHYLMTLELIASVAIVSIYLIKVIFKYYLRRMSSVSSLRMKAKLVASSMKSNPHGHSMHDIKQPHSSNSSNFENFMSSSTSVSSIAEDENYHTPSQKHHAQHQISQEHTGLGSGPGKQHHKSGGGVDDIKLNTVSNVLLYFENKIIYISGLVTWRMSAYFGDTAYSAIEEAKGEVKSNKQYIPPGLYGRDESKNYKQVHYEPEGMIAKICASIGKATWIFILSIGHLIGQKGNNKAIGEYYKRQKEINKTISISSNQSTGSGGNEATPIQHDGNRSGTESSFSAGGSDSVSASNLSASSLDKSEKSFTTAILRANFGVGVACQLRKPPKVRIFGCSTFDGDILHFLSNDEVNRLFDGIVLSNNRRLTGADCRHSAALAGFGTAIGNHFGCSSIQPPPVIMPASGSVNPAETDATAAAFGELSPPLLFLLLSRCLWFQRISITNCPGLIGSVFSLTPLADLTHLELGGGVPDGYEHGYNRYGHVENAKVTAYSRSSEDDEEGKDEDEGQNIERIEQKFVKLNSEADLQNGASSSESNSLNKGGGVERLDYTGHEYRMTIKGVSGRLVDLKAFTKLVVLNLSGTSVTGNISVLDELVKLQVLDLASTAVEGDIKVLAKCTQLTDVNFW